jgi:hypothetical protein
VSIACTGTQPLTVNPNPTAKCPRACRRRRGLVLCGQVSSVGLATCLIRCAGWLPVHVYQHVSALYALRYHRMLGCCTAGSRVCKQPVGKQPVHVSASSRYIFINMCLQAA